MALKILEMGLGILDKVLPDADAKAKAKLELLKLEQEGNLKELEISLSAILAEAQSQDKWTSRARPSFMYVIYVFILTAIPMGFLFAFKPLVAEAVTRGVGLWLTAIPDELYMLFGAGYLGYTGARSYDKAKAQK